jgi:predicted Zn-dependent protease
MKTLKYLTISSILYLAACQQQNEEVKPTNTGSTNTNTNPAPVVVPKSWALSTKEGKEAYDELIRLVFKTSDGSQARNVVKWTENIPKIQIFVDGSKDATMNKALETILAELKTLNKVNTYELIGSATGAEMIINRDTFEKHNAKYTNAQVPTPNIAGYTVYTYGSSGLMNATIWINPAITSNNLNYIVRHEFTHAMGLGHTTNINSIMYSTV